MRHIMILASAVLLLAACSKTSSSGSAPDSGGGQGGSLARFTLAGNYLYMVDSRVLYTYDIASGTPVRQNEQKVDNNTEVETIYAYGDYLFIGSSDAMYIYSIASPSKPTRQSRATHVRACDPVVANDSMAYVTVRTGTTCGGTQNALLVYNVRNVMQPKQLNSVPMANPHGLGIKDTLLYVCDGTNGLRIYSLKTPGYPIWRRSFTSANYLDVIPTKDLLICMVEKGMILYGYNTTGSYLEEKARIGN